MNGFYLTEGLGLEFVYIFLYLNRAIIFLRILIWSKLDHQQLLLKLTIIRIFIFLKQII